MKTVSILSIVTFITLASSIQASEALPIRNRIQWLENNGYCGETSLQECALYYGIYASQAYIRGIYDPTQQNDLVELEEWAVVLAKLGLKPDYFPTDKIVPPQYKTFEVWAKRQLSLKRPVISTCYIGGPGNDPVDHIITLSSFTAATTTTYSDADLFTFNHHLGQTTDGLPGAPAAFALQAKWLFDERSMAGPGKLYGYAIQKEVDYGIAIIGTTNTSVYNRPVRLELDRINEPNLVTGEKPVALNAEISIGGLTPKATYVLYRYDDPAKVPTTSYSSKPSASKVTFKATSTVQTLQDTILSSGVAVFRCLPAGR